MTGFLPPLPFFAIFLLYYYSRFLFTNNNATNVNPTALITADHQINHLAFVNHSCDVLVSPISKCKSPISLISNSIATPMKSTTNAFLVRDNPFKSRVLTTLNKKIKSNIDTGIAL